MGKYLQDKLVLGASLRGPVFSPDARLTMSHFVAAHVFSVKFALRGTSEEFCWERTILEKNSMHFANTRDLTDAQWEI